jgi:hypothetical protein
MKKLLIALSILCLTNTIIFADAPDEIMYIDKNNIPTDLLKKTIGIITINSGVKGGISLHIYNDSFVIIKSLNLRDDSQPISNYGYHPPVDTLISNFRYLLIDENERFIKIVYNHNQSKTAWIKKTQLNDNFYSSKINYTDNLKTDYGCFLSLFEFTNDEKIIVYALPSDNSKNTLISKNDCDNQLIKIIEQKGEFLKIGIAEINSQLQTVEIKKEIGWIKIKDANGALNVWIIKRDLFG